MKRETPFRHRESAAGGRGDLISGITALILAAGRSSRMGEFKPLLPLGGRTVVERSIALFRKAGVGDILVVAGFEAERLIPVLERCEAGWAVNKDYDRGMFSSLQVGVSHLAASTEAFFVLPVDHPFVKPETVRSLIESRRDARGKILRPCHRGRRGHPPLIPAALAPAIRGFTEPGGLRALLSRYEDRTLNVECDDPGVLADLDTREDYERTVLISGRSGRRPRRDSGRRG